MTAGLTELFSATVLGSSVYVILWLFLIYSFIGVIVEMIFCLAVEGVLESRSGLLYIPLRPIYGLGGVACVLFLELSREPIWLFLFGMLVGSVIEYIAGLLVEKVFGTVAWDYSDKRWNLHGRICLQYSVAWGLLALLVGYVLDPMFARVGNVADRRLGETVLTVLMGLTLLAGVITAAALIRTRRRVAALQARGPGQPVMATSAPWERVIDRLAPESVIINSFPRTSLTIQLLELTGAQRDWIRIPAWPSRQLASGAQPDA
jgi:uncharacterized membrane protein